MTPDNSEPVQPLRLPVAAGPANFYPSEQPQLMTAVKAHISAARKVAASSPFGLISPHAGFIFSGPTAGWAFRQVQGLSHDAVVILGPSHYHPLTGADIMPRGAYRTPLGDLPVHSDIAAEIVSEAGVFIRLNPAPHLLSPIGRGEHSIEVQLPFIQVAMGDVPIVPVLMGDLTQSEMMNLGAAIAHVAQRYSLLVVASSDLSHYKSQQTAERMDRRAIDLITAGDIAEFSYECDWGRIEACGWQGIVVLMAAAELSGAGDAVLLNYRTSGDTPHADRNMVVGYAAVGFYPRNG